METPATYIIFTTTVTVIFIVLLIYIISIVVYPKQPIKYLRKKLNLTTSPNLEDDSTNNEVFVFKNTELKLYYLEKTPPTDTVIIDIPGGAFISSSNTLSHYKHIDQPHSIVSIEYPVLPKGTYKLAINCITAIFDYLLNTKYPNKKIVISSGSAGSYYATKLVNSEKFNNRITKFITMSGYFGYNTLPNIYTYITEIIYLHRTLKQNNNEFIACKPIPSHIETFFAVGEMDPLKTSTYKFLEQSGQSNQVIEYNNATHCFYLKYNNSVTQEFYKDLITFLTN